MPAAVPTAPRARDVTTAVRLPTPPLLDFRRIARGTPRPLRACRAFVRPRFGSPIHLPCPTGICQGQRARQIRRQSANAVTSRTCSGAPSSSGRALCGIAQTTVRFRTDEVENARARSATATRRESQNDTATERRGASTRNYSGIVVANGRSITLRNSSGRWVSLSRRGDALYGVAQDVSGYALQISVQKDSGRQTLR